MFGLRFRKDVQDEQDTLKALNMVLCETCGVVVSRGYASEIPVVNYTFDKLASRWYCAAHAPKFDVFMEYEPFIGCVPSIVVGTDDLGRPFDWESVDEVDEFEAEVDAEVEELREQIRQLKDTLDSVLEKSAGLTPPESPAQTTEERACECYS